MKALFLALFISGLCFAETRDVIALVDTGKSQDLRLKPFYCDTPAVDFTGTNVYDYYGHGSEMASLIAKYINRKTTCILSIKWYHTQQHQLKGTLADAIKVVESYSQLLLDLKPKYINMSLAGNLFSYQELKALDQLVKQNTYVMIASGNENQDLSLNCNAYPACYKIMNPHYRVVSSYTGYFRNPVANYNGPVNSKENGFNQCALGRCSTGTSAATAVYTGKLAAGIIKLK